MNVIMSGQVSSDTQPRAQIEGHQAHHVFPIGASQTQIPPYGHSQPPSQPFCFRLRRESQWVLLASWSPGSLRQCCISAVTCSRHLLLLGEHWESCRSRGALRDPSAGCAAKERCHELPQFSGWQLLSASPGRCSLYTPDQVHSALEVALEDCSLRPSADFRLVKECSQHLSTKWQLHDRPLCCEPGL